MMPLISVQLFTALLLQVSLLHVCHSMLSQSHCKAV